MTEGLIKPKKITQEELQKISFEYDEKVHIFSDNLDWSALSLIADKARDRNVKISFSNNDDQEGAYNRIFHII